MDIAFESREDNALTGSFTINSLTFYQDANNKTQIANIDVDFVQYSRGVPGPALHGHFTFSSSAISSVPGPSGLVSMGMGLTSVATFLGRRFRSRVGCR
ncbi:hypothetical protein FRUB_04954 [Fimbriiglobus ruber]|uniref:Uncharacterized protein n=1 Tax=Fimbriiglobus ruber TaxID=1908690 RepID=A0A225DI01_9BACT|nr:hypothetical protein FRUB_04954 [Fimbriiglobus ruber]